MLTTADEYLAGKKKRSVVERPYGDMKSHHGFAVCRYTGRLKMELQAYLTALTHNLKTLVTKLTGAKLRYQSHSHVF